MVNPVCRLENNLTHFWESRERGGASDSGQAVGERERGGRGPGVRCTVARTLTPTYIGDPGTSVLTVTDLSLGC